jgi:hypothetical protein
MRVLSLPPRKLSREADLVASCVGGPGHALVELGCHAARSLRGQRP